MTHLPDNVSWHALSGAQAQHALGSGGARRYAPGFPALVAFSNPLEPDLASLAPLCEPGKPLYTLGLTGALPAGWRVDGEVVLLRMRWDGEMPVDEAPDAVLLGSQHADDILELLRHIPPSPFGLRTVELGDYFGYFVDGRLVAMAGERLYAGTVREISNVCTHPDFRRQGMVARLMLKLIRHAMLRGETSFLHVLSDNLSAQRLYRAMGFRDHCEVAGHVIMRD